jgi:hypothetical protein
MRWKKINSRYLTAVGYDPTSLLLEVKFKISKKIYGFMNVPKNVYEAFMDARSKGNYFNVYIKNRFQFVEIQKV